MVGLLVICRSTVDVGVPTACDRLGGAKGAQFEANLALLRAYLGFSPSRSPAIW